MAFDNDLASLRERIKETYASWPPAIKRVAKFTLDFPVEVALQPLRQVATRSGSGPTTVIRFTQLLGFDSYEAFREVFRTGLRGGSWQYAKRAEILQHRGTRWPVAVEIASAARQGIQESFAGLEAKTLDAIGTAINKARIFYLIGGRSAFAPAFYAYYLASIFLSSPRLVEGRFGMSAEELKDASPRDAALAISFSPYARDTVVAMQTLAAAGVTTIAITDSAVSPIAVCSKHIIEVSTSSPSYYISLVPAFCVIEAVLAVTALQTGKKGVDAIRKNDQLRQGAGTYWESKKLRDGDNRGFRR